MNRTEKGDSRTAAGPDSGSQAGRWMSRLRIGLVTFFFTVPALGALLSFLQVLYDGKGGVEGLAGVIGVAVSPDGQQVYAVGQGDNALAVFQRNGDWLSFVEMHQDGVVFGLEGASAVAVSPDGRHVYATAFVDDSLVIFARDGTVDELSFAGVKENNVGGVFGLDGASSVTVSPDSQQVFVTGSVDAALVAFNRDGSTDELVFVDLQMIPSGLAGASSVAVSPDNRHIYVTGEADDSLVVFSRNIATGDVTFTALHTDGIGDVDGLAGASSVAVSPDGKHVYTTGRGDTPWRYGSAIRSPAH